MFSNSQNRSFGPFLSKPKFYLCQTPEDTVFDYSQSCDKPQQLHHPGMMMTDLEYDDVVARIPSNGSCNLKWHPEGPALQRDVVKIWLNKLPVLCKYAAERPDAVTTLIDANANIDMLRWANTTARQLQHGKLGVPTMPNSLGLVYGLYRIYRIHGSGSRSYIKLKFDNFFLLGSVWRSLNRNPCGSFSYMVMGYCG